MNISAPPLKTSIAPLDGAMPILPRESDVYPPDLLDDDPEATGPWWVLYSLPRREKELMRRLRAKEIPHYGPLIRQQRRSPAGRVRTSFVPLFPGYVFLSGGEEPRYAALQTNCVARCLAVSDPGRMVHDLRQIRQLVASDAPLTPEARLESGMRVRVRTGPLMGLEGVVTERRGRANLLVAVEFIQRGASVEIGDYDLEPI